jgi:predicted O-methyltransferase YrrM
MRKKNYSKENQMENNIYLREVTLNILLISTDPIILDIFEKVFCKYGHIITRILQPIEAIKLIEEKERTDPFDILFIDYDKYQEIDRNSFSQTIKINGRIIISTWVLLLFTG